MSNIRNFIKKKKNQVHWKCTIVAQLKNLDYNDQIGERNKNKKAKLNSNQGEYGKRKT